MSETAPISFPSLSAFDPNAIEKVSPLIASFRETCLRSIFHPSLFIAAASSSSCLTFQVTLLPSVVFFPSTTHLFLPAFLKGRSSCLPYKNSFYFDVYKRTFRWFFKFKSAPLPNLFFSMFEGRHLARKRSRASYFNWSFCRLRYNTLIGISDRVWLICIWNSICLFCNSHSESNVRVFNKVLSYVSFVSIFHYSLFCMFTQETIEYALLVPSRPLVTLSMLSLKLTELSLMPKINKNQQK